VVKYDFALSIESLSREMIRAVDQSLFSKEGNCSVEHWSMSWIVFFSSVRWTKIPI